MCTIMDITLSEYLANLKNFDGSHRTLLFGNGLGLSHPDDAVRRAFDFDGLRTSIDIRHYLHEWITQDNPSPIDELKNPEVFLQVIRLKTIGKVLDGYMKRINSKVLDKAIKPYKNNIINLLSYYNIVFSLNYDSISYRFFQPVFKISKDVKFKFKD